MQYEFTIIDVKDADALVINYHDGWEIISADKRTPIVLAQSDSGYFDIAMMAEQESSQGPILWLSQLALGVYNFRSTSEIEIQDREIEESIQSSLLFWLHVTNPEAVINCQTKGGGEIINPPITEGHWELTNVYTETVDYEATKLTSTTWNQDGGYNYYCPLKSYSTTERAPAGCVAVAGAQMLYYLHNKIGLPVAVPSCAYCSGNVFSYIMFQYNASTTVWDNMGLYYATDASAVLIAHMGSLVGMQYGDNGSGVINSLAKLRDDVFSLYGINSTLTSFDESTVKVQLLSGMPVICSAHPCGPLNLPDLSNGHTFLIDGYNNALVKYTYVYEWVYDNVDPEQMVDLIEPIIEISYAWHPTNQISMNWGWGGAYNSVLFSYTGDWNVGGYNFEYYRNILYNFTAAE